jgi:hypothetical protein
VELNNSEAGVANLSVSPSYVNGWRGVFDEIGRRNILGAAVYRPLAGYMDVVMTGCYSVGSEQCENVDLNPAW